jgi:protein-tyrosine phosphatase
VVGVLFVCTGNICRSPTAEGVFIARAKAAGLIDRLDIDSAGTHDYHVGEPPDPRAIAHAARRGIDIAQLRARKLRREDFTRFDYVLAMDRGHERLLLRQAGAAKDRVRLYLDFAPQLAGQDVPDPYYGKAEDFERVLDLVEPATEALIEHIRRTHFAS